MTEPYEREPSKSPTPTPRPHGGGSTPTPRTRLDTLAPDGQPTIEEQEQAQSPERQPGYEDQVDAQRAACTPLTAWMPWMQPARLPDAVCGAPEVKARTPTQPSVDLPPLRPGRSRQRTPEQSDAVIAAQRASYTATAVSTKVRHFVNPALLSLFPVEREGGERRARFLALVNQAKALYAAMDKLDTAKIKLEGTKAQLAKAPEGSKRRVTLEAELATQTSAIAAATTKAEADLAVLLAEGQGVRQKLVDDLSAAVANAERQLIELPERIADLETQLAALAAKQSETSATLKRTSGGKPAPEAPEGPALSTDEAGTRRRALQNEINDLKSESAKLARELLVAKKELTPIAKDLPNLKLTLERAGKVEQAIIAVEQTQWRVKHKEDGKGGGLDLVPVGGGANTDRPQGHRHGGVVDFTGDDWSFAWDRLPLSKEDKTDDEINKAGQSVIRILRSHEGKTDSVNTWDRAILTLAAALTGGVLAKMFWTLSQTDPAFFASEIASLGIGIEKRGNDHFLLYKDPATGKTHFDHAARAAIAADPLVLGALRRVCGMKPVREQLALRTLDYSFKYALDWTFTVEGAPDLLGFDGAKSKTIVWRDVTALAAKSDMTQAALAVIADQRHAAGNADNYKAAVAKKLLALAKAGDMTVAALLREAPICVELVRHLIHQHPTSRRKNITAEFPNAFSE